MKTSIDEAVPVDVAEDEPKYEILPTGSKKGFPLLLDNKGWVAKYLTHWT